MDTKTCLHCGKAFAPKYRVTAAYWAKRLYCSNECKHAAKAAQPGIQVEVKCSECGAARLVFPSTNRKGTVCRECREKKVEVTCPRCGKKRLYNKTQAAAMAHGYCGDCRPYFDRHYDLTIPDTWSGGYVMAVMIGDGTLIYSYRGKHGRLPCGIRLEVTSFAFAQKFLENVTALTGKTTNIHKKQRLMKANPKISMPETLLTLYTVDISGRELHETIAQVKKGRRFELLQPLSREFKDGFLQGLLDAEGYIRGETGRTRFANKDRGLLGVAQRMLAEKGVKSAIYGPYEGSRGVMHLSFTGTMEKTR